MTGEPSDEHLWLFRLRMPPRDREAAKRFSDLHQVHQLTMHAFPDGPGNTREDHQVLWRADTHPDTSMTLLVQSRTRPDLSRLLVPASWAVDQPRPVSHQHLRDGDRIRFQLRANPTKRSHQDRKRVGLNGPDAHLDWLLRHQIHDHGQAFTVDTDPYTGEPAVAIISEPDRPCRKGGRPFHFRSTTFSGTLTITDHNRFRRILEKGIGPAKAYGFGFLTTAPLINRSGPLAVSQ
ncbi:type I-E CRISPR-associated protein Cas6/Cse3/CasE [Frankia sp. Ag45/Mut15]|uniref:Type I-E CRISPR-associated protein Cas6/Cse3/CasE n=1 Tax=Frankia umida TaxID=573489 RepID=A0ABT0K3B8_9ACTN|nr:type I-E CRISPR-associated protein Cas6/Cse3/CasE [Frankia umida]MCK9878260.1 type I-E CRISPR-associated protein Cas6/Cse3/CasE [Frankia umida]